MCGNIHFKSQILNDTGNNMYATWSSAIHRSKNWHKHVIVSGSYLNVTRFNWQYPKDALAWF